MTPELGDCVAEVAKAVELEDRLQRRELFTPGNYTRCKRRVRYPVEHSVLRVAGWEAGSPVCECEVGAHRPDTHRPYRPFTRKRLMSEAATS